MKSNKIVLLLPVGVMIMLFIFGYYTLVNDERMTHLELEDHIQFQTEEEDHDLRVSWQWEQHPEGSLFGNDYIEVTFGEPVVINRAEVELLHRNEVIYSVSEWIETGDNRIAVPFPTQMLEQNLYGPNGIVSVNFEGAVDIEAIHYVHTWMDVEVSKKDGPTLEQRFEEAGMINFWRKRVDQ